MTWSAHCQRKFCHKTIKLLCKRETIVFRSSRFRSWVNKDSEPAHLQRDGHRPLSYYHVVYMGKGCEKSGDQEASWVHFHLSCVIWFAIPPIRLAFGLSNPFTLNWIFFIYSWTKTRLGVCRMENRFSTASIINHDFQMWWIYDGKSFGSSKASLARAVTCKLFPFRQLFPKDFWGGFSCFMRQQI